MKRGYVHIYWVENIYAHSPFSFLALDIFLTKGVKLQFHL